MLVNLCYLLINAFGLLVALVAFFIIYLQWCHQYWIRKNLNQLPPSIPFGNIPSPFYQKESFGVTLKKNYEAVRSKGWKHAGLYMLHRPVYFAVNLEYVKNILSRDFNHFADRGMYYNEKDDPISAHLFAVGGTKWRTLRPKITPTFSPGKIKMMFPIIVACLDNLEVMIRQKNTEINIKDILGIFIIDIIGSVAFGLDLKTFKNEESPFRKYAQNAFRFSAMKTLKIMMANTFPNFARTIGVRFISKEISTFTIDMVKDTVDYREKNNFTRNDFMQLLIELKNNNQTKEPQNSENTVLTVEEIAAQAFIFFAAGFETSSITTTFALYELSRHQEIQDKVRQEINSVLLKHNGEITFNAIQEMKYMDQVFDETLRKYPPIPFVDRTCVKDYTVPGTDLVIEEGTKVIIPIVGIHHDEEYYPSPDIFDPDRFSEENKRTRPQYAHIPFGEGPRVCIGRRFAMTMTKVALAHLLKHYRFTVNAKTQEPITFSPKSLPLTPNGNIWLDSHRL